MLSNPVSRIAVAAVLVLATSVPSAVVAQSASPPAQTGATRPAPKTPPASPATPPATGPSVATPADFVVGPEDVLAILFWRDQEMSSEVVVRPDGMITLPLLRDIQAAGLTTDQLADRIQTAAAEFIADPTVTVVVRQVNSRKVFIVGEVVRPGVYPLTSAMNVMQLIALAGGLTEMANSKNLSIARIEGQKTRNFKFNYRDVVRGRRQEQNIALQPGDTVVVP